MTTTMLFVIGLSVFSSCQHTTPGKSPPLEIDALVESFRKLPKQTQLEGLQNTWTFFTTSFNFSEFQNSFLQTFPSFGILEKADVLTGNTALDLRPLRLEKANPIALLLSIDLEMELLSRFHSQTFAAPRCLETFWTDWNLKIPSTARAELAESNATQSPLEKTLENPIQTSDAREIPMNENATRLGIYLKQALGLDKATHLKVLSNSGERRAKFKIPSGDVYEIFSSPVECKAYKEKKYVVPTVGKIKCLQKQSATWMTVLAKESTMLEGNWALETKKRCARWTKPLNDITKLDFEQKMRNSPLASSWSLYPRLRSWVIRQADRYEAAFQKSVR